MWNSDLGFSTVVGFEPDLEAVELLYTSLLVQGTAAMAKAEADSGPADASGPRRSVQSFLMAYVQRLGARLAADTAAGDRGLGPEEGAAAGDLLPVLAARDVAVTDAADRMFPETTSTRLRGVSDGEGWAHGTAAADRARMGERRPGIDGTR